MKKLSLLFFLICEISFSQNLEEAIYTAAETFISNKNDASLKLLTQQETSFKNHVKAKDEQLALVFLQCHKGYYLDEHLKLKDAITTYEDALKRFNTNQLSKLSDFDIIESCLKPLGNLYTKTGDYTNAENTIKQYIFLAETLKNKKHKISGFINLAQLYLTVGKYKNALSITAEGLNLKEISNSQRLKLSQININSQIALKLVSSSKDIPAINDIDKYDLNTLDTEYNLAIANKNYEKALVLLNKLTTKAYTNKSTSRELAKYHLKMAQIHYKLNHLEACLIELETALKALIPNFTPNGLPNKKDLYAENTFIDIFDLYAVIQTNTETALESYNLSFYVSELLQENWTSQEAKIFNETNNRNRSETCIALLLNRYQQTKIKSVLFEAFQYCENNKASILKDINYKKKRLKQHPKDSLLIKELKLLKTQEYYTGLLIKEQLSTNKASTVNDLSEKLSNISLHLKTLKTAISKKYPENNDSFSLKILQEKLREDHAVLVEYFFGKNNIYQFIISKKNIEVESIPLTNDNRKSIVDFIHLFDDASVINNNINNYTNQAFDVFELLKFNKLSTYENVVIIPDGLLNFLPFEALLTAKTTTTSFSKMPFVVKNKNVVYNSSASFYLSEPDKSKNNGLLGFFPVFENTNQKLTYSINEAEAIKKEMNSSIFLSSKASKNNFIKNASKYRILHLSTHASSGDFVNPATISFYDDALILNELYSLDLNPNLVVLSACETGIGKLYKGEGAMSIARGFQYAGAENLLFSLWQINDLSTSQIMQSFYNNYNNQESAFKANYNSKIEYLENDAISNVKKSPYYWSAFVYYGTLEKEKPNNMVFYIIFGILIFLIVLLLFLKFKKS